MILDNCKLRHINSQKINKLKKSPLPSDVLQNLAETFKILGDPTRLNIINLLSQQELCV